jgi:hypothetical protein
MAARWRDQRTRTHVRCAPLLLALGAAAPASQLLLLRARAWAAGARSIMTPACMQLQRARNALREAENQAARSEGCKRGLN